ncbi:hypothetical protein CK222_21775 [Mesorhizobium sp. WSM3866]|uniref:hypothetical protein n=1 Tax=Mesorhizobium sp. WSM3866 TaxID=422271 RepID=UPI000BAEAF9F|nr:hypothetical protein [Mesorhizobium sp. WSM3866]PBB41786.1 hypothetical protein CK222_21775 [Mesorhizobium sp. WSM3866]TIU88817.1 MAG: hypothetical protein E5W06_00165 [Mesorhizobium sp.]
MTAAIAIAWLRKWVWPVLSFGITLPVWAFLIAGTWLYFDKASAIRTAVNQAVTKLVAGAELEALNAKLTEERRIRQWAEAKVDETNRLAEIDRQAREDLEKQSNLSRLDNRKRKDDLVQIEARALPDGCRVDEFLFNRMRNK